MRSVPIFSQWAKSQIFLEFLFACCTSDVFSPFSSSTVVECFSQANNSQPSGYVTQVLRVSRPLGANCPEKSKAFVGQLALNPESSHCLARNQRIFKEHLHGTLWMLIKGTLYKWAKARRTRNSPADFVYFTGSELRTLFYEVLTLCSVKLTFMGFMCRMTLQFRNPNEMIFKMEW